MKSNLKPLILSGAILVAVAVLMSFRTFTEIPYMFRNFSFMADNNVPAMVRFASFLDFISIHAIAIGGLGLVLIAFLVKTPSVTRIAAIAYGVFGPIFGLLSSTLWTFFSGNNVAT